MNDVTCVAPTAPPAILQATKPPTKAALVEAMLLRSEGASLEDLCQATGWQPHSVRGAMAGALKKRGLNITSDKVGGVRRYRASMPAS